jgi:benzoyl-CoA reductase/2-hydroxyglutaryl-CoA dehydratase subunit BcrC/BadD/HgdB
MVQAENKYPMWDNIVTYVVRMKELFETMMSTTKAGEQIVNPKFLGILSTYLKGLYEAETTGKPKIMNNFCIPPEILYALDAYPIVEEAASVLLSVVGKQHIKYIDFAEENGIAAEQCNAQKIWIGAMMQDEAAKPDGIVYASQPCDSTNILYQLIQNWYDIPTFTMDVPYWSYDPESTFYDERTIPYFANQLKSIVPWAEKNFNLTLDMDRLKHVIGLSNKAREAALEINEIMTAVPAPLPSMTTFTTYVSLATSAGTPQCAEYLEWTRDKAAAIVKRKTGAMQEVHGKEEKFRVVWIYIPIFWDFMMYDWMERKFGAVTVMDLMGYNLSQPIDTSSEESIFEGLSKVILSIPMGAQSRGPAEYYMDYLFHIVKKYKADCAIYGGHMGCKHSWGVANLLKEELYNQTGIPTLLFEVDTMDPRQVTSKVIRQKLRTFFQEVM